jgi:hypothetical protein
MRWFRPAFGVLLLCSAALAQQETTPQKEPAPAAAPATSDRPAEQRKRIELNLLGATDTQGGESRRNENRQFNLIDNNALKELNVRLGVSATLVEEFRPDRNWFGVEIGNPPAASLPVVALKKLSAWHGNARWTHLNSVTSARSFFQVGGVKPAYENEWSAGISGKLWRGASLTLNGGQQRIRGMVNGNVLVPRADERTPLATDPAVRAIVQRYFNAYPDQVPNRTDINPRMLNTNAPQRINGENATARLDQDLSSRDRLSLLYTVTRQKVDAFQLVAGQNPNTTTRSQRTRATWARTIGARTLFEGTVGYERLTSLLVPERNAVGPMVSIGGLTTLGPTAIIPINRAVNLFRGGAQIRHSAGRHDWYAGSNLNRRQLNGVETDAHRGFFSFGNDFGRDAITNLRLGTPTQHIISLGDVDRGFRNWELDAWAGDVWRASARVTLNYGLRWAPVTKPNEVNHRNQIAYSSDWNNLAPMVGVAWSPGNGWGVFRAGGGVQFGEVFPVTYQQVRFTPPGSVKIVVPTPYLPDPLESLTGEMLKSAKGNVYALDPHLATPYEFQYNASWEHALGKDWRLQLGYVGSRMSKLLLMLYKNRAHPVPGIPQTTATLNDRRPDPTIADYRLVVNGSRGYYDAARVSVIAPRWHGFTVESAYWFSKAIDLGADYANTAYDADSRLSRGQWEYNVRADMKGRSNFDQPHSALVRVSYATGSGAPKWARGWRVSLIALAKSGTPFTVVSGSDGPGYGNVDGNGGDRPNLIDPSILGRTVGNPDTSQALLPPSAFRYMQPTDPWGNLGRNTFRKSRIANTNASIEKEWRWNGERRVTLRAESINLTNTPQFAEPGLELSNPNFGAITNTLNDGRTFRFGLGLGW